MKIVSTHTGVYCLIQNIDRNILLIKKSRGPYKGKFDLPGGKIEAGESDIETVKREVLEETGAVLHVAKYLKEYKITFEYIDEKSQTIEFTHIGKIFEAIDIDLKNIEDKVFEDSLGIVWINPSEINEQNSSPFAFRAVQSH